MAHALETYQQAENELRSGKYAEALEHYLETVRAVPQFWRARFRIADTLLNFKAREQALEIYRSIAWHAIKAGSPLEGLVAIKMAAALDPSLTDVVSIMAQLYSRDSDRVSKDHEEAPRLLPTPDDAVTPANDLAGQALVDAAAREAADTEGVAKYPDHLPSIPLFSFLDEGAFTAVLASLQLRRFVKGQKIIEEGQPGDSFFILAEGDVEVTRSVKGKLVKLARLHAGAVFGEMALITRAPRTATVIANNDCDLLELKRASLEAQANELASVTQALKEFTHERFLTNLTATSAVFKPFPPTIRKEIVRRFQDFPVDPGDELIAEAEEGQGLFLILKGNVEVTKKADGGQPVKLARLNEGDVFGEISLIQDTATTATCTAVTRGDLLFLPKREFKGLIARHPEMKDELAKITAERVQKTKALMEPTEYELIEDDDLIML
ncbi:MAG: cyclic nucleotide-binding domain-containing protein [Deltaproteobacteria bacterium]|nr:cyclic nucleotide-binding domain-containing protein [Deltaproteobacteria bacterium]